MTQTCDDLTADSRPRGHRPAARHVEYVFVRVRGGYAVSHRSFPVPHLTAGPVEGEADAAALEWLRGSRMSATTVVAVCVPERREWIYRGLRHVSGPAPDGCRA